MEQGPERKDLQELADFERSLGEEVAVSAEYGLSLTLLTARIEDGWTAEATRRALDTLRVADLVAQQSPQDIVAALPNTATDTAWAAEERLREAVPEAITWKTPWAPPETAGELMDRTRRSSPGS